MRENLVGEDGKRACATHLTNGDDRRAGTMPRVSAGAGRRLGLGDGRHARAGEERNVTSTECPAAIGNRHASAVVGGAAGVWAHSGFAWSVLGVRSDVPGFTGG